MKKILFAAALAGAAFMTACGGKDGGVRMGSLSDFDSLSYSLRECSIPAETVFNDSIK